MYKPYHLHVPIVLKSGSLNLLEPSGPLQACNGIALPLRYCIMHGTYTVPECNVSNVIAFFMNLHVTLWHSNGLLWHRSLLYSNENIFLQNLQFLKRPYLSISGNIMKLLWHSIIIPIWRSKCHYNSVDCLWMKQYWSRVRL